MVNLLTQVGHPDKEITLPQLKEMIDDDILNVLQQLVDGQGQGQAENNPEQPQAQEEKKEE